MGWLGRLTARMENWSASSTSSAGDALIRAARRRTEEAIAHSLSSCVAILYLNHERDVAALTRAHYPNATDEEIEQLRERVRHLDTAAYELCERGPDGKALRANEEISAELTARFPGYPSQVLDRAIGNAHYAWFHG